MASVPTSPAEYKFFAEYSKALTLQRFLCWESFWLWLSKNKLQSLHWRSCEVNAQPIRFGVDLLFCLGY